MKSKATRRESGFTLVELLIVIAIIGVLMGLALAGMRFAQQRARDLQRQNLVRNIGTALEAYYVDKRAYPGGDGTTVTNASQIVSEPGQQDDLALDDYVENSLELPEGVELTDIGYYTPDGFSYMVCMFPEADEASGNEANLITSGTDSGYKTLCADNIVVD